MRKIDKIVGFIVGASLVMAMPVQSLAAVDTLGASTEVTATEKTVVAEAGSKTPAPTRALAYIKPNFNIQIGEEFYLFKDVNGARVYPIVYDGSTYLPVRAISEIMDEDIAWENANRTVYIGKTLDNPAGKSKSKSSDEKSDKGSDKDSRETAGQGKYALGMARDKYLQPEEKTSTVTVNIRPDVKILYDFNQQDFKDANGSSVYPMIYQGSTYLPIRAISQLMGKDVDWDNVAKTVVIAEKSQKEIAEEKKLEEEKKKLEEEKKKLEEEKKAAEEAARKELLKLQKENTRVLKAELDTVTELYDAATQKISTIQTAKTQEDKQMVADSISSDVQEIERQLSYAKSIKRDSFTEEQQAAYQALCEFIQMTQHYFLIMENIAYMSANDLDYSMLAETFLEFALNAQNGKGQAEHLIEKLV